MPPGHDRSEIVAEQGARVAVRGGIALRFRCTMALAEKLLLRRVFIQRAVIPCPKRGAELATCPDAGHDVFSRGEEAASLLVLLEQQTIRGKRRGVCLNGRA